MLYNLPGIRYCIHAISSSCNRTLEPKKEVFSDTRTSSPACYNICDKDRQLINKRFDSYMIYDDGNVRESGIALGDG